jgi:hypothetical protein
MSSLSAPSPPWSVQAVKQRATRDAMRDRLRISISYDDNFHSLSYMLQPLLEGRFMEAKTKDYKRTITCSRLVVPDQP